MAERKEPKEPREITARLVRQGADEREFDLQFWKTIPPERRVEMLWDMVLELRALRGESGDEPRLQRSVLHVRRL
jgi:hypothetical protein